MGPGNGFTITNQNDELWARLQALVDRGEQRIRWYGIGMRSVFLFARGVWRLLLQLEQIQPTYFERSLYACSIAIHARDDGNWTRTVQVAAITDST